MTPKFKSKFELFVYNTAVNAGHKLRYEPRGAKLTYVLPPRSYTPDFVLSNGIIVETKGFLRYDDLRKMTAVKADHPDLDIRIVFQKAHRPLRKGGAMTYAGWADKAGFPWAEGTIPDSWFTERK